jgi:hypothetical protein
VTTSKHHASSPNETRLGFIETESTVISIQKMADPSNITLDQLRAGLYERFAGLMTRLGRGDEAAELFGFLASPAPTTSTAPKSPTAAGLFPTL